MDDYDYTNFVNDPKITWQDYFEKKCNVFVITGKCVCNDGFGSTDCSLNLNRPPLVEGLIDDGLCDEHELECSHVFVYGQTFVNSQNLTCRLEEFQVRIRTIAICIICMDFNSLLYRF